MAQKKKIQTKKKKPRIKNARVIRSASKRVVRVVAKRKSKRSTKKRITLMSRVAQSSVRGGSIAGLASARSSLLGNGGAKIKVVGVGGGGGNAISRMTGFLPRGVELIAINTDLQDLEFCQARKRLYIGKNTTRGLGAGMNPELGRQSAEENREEIAQVLVGADIVFLTSGFGGGTGTGALPVVAEIAKEMGIVTIAIVTKPFSFEGAQRAQIAQEGIERLKDRVDTYITIPNDRIFAVIDKDTSLQKSFLAIDEVLRNAVSGISEIILSPGIVNVDFADIKTIVENSGPSIIGVGIGSGKERALAAANGAINSPLLESSLDGARGVLFSISGHKDLKMNEVNEIAKRVSESVDPSARIIFGAYYDRKLPKGQIKVTLIATGFGSAFGRNYSLFGDFEIFGKRDTIEYERGREEQHSSPVVADEGPSEEVSPVAGQQDTLVDDDGEGLWDVPAFLRKKKRK